MAHAADICAIQTLSSTISHEIYIDPPSTPHITKHLAISEILLDDFIDTWWADFIASQHEEPPIAYGTATASASASSSSIPAEYPLHHMCLHRAQAIYPYRIPLDSIYYPRLRYHSQIPIIPAHSISCCNYTSTYKTSMTYKNTEITLTF